MDSDNGSFFSRGGYDPYCVLRDSMLNIGAERFG